MIGRRPVSKFLSRLTDLHAYRALWRMFRVHEHPLAVAYREAFSTAHDYPVTLNIHTPLGKRPVHLFHPEDLSTLDTVFCRLDYDDPRPLETVVDFGSATRPRCSPRSRRRSGSGSGTSRSRTTSSTRARSFPTSSATRSTSW